MLQYHENEYQKKNPQIWWEWVHYKTYVKHEENLLSDAQKILTYKNLFFQNQCLLKTPNFQPRISLKCKCKLWGQYSAQ